VLPYSQKSKIYTGVNLKSQKLDICSEWVAFGKALSEGETEFEMTVAVHRAQDGELEIYPPCSLCRELYLTYCPDIIVIIPNEETATASDLLPKAWKKRQK